jgi:FixJ family two-component response regulator
MPQLGGKALAERLKAKYPQLKVLFISGYSNEAITQENTLEPEAAFLEKPFSPMTLVAKVREVLDSEIKGPL